MSRTLWFCGWVAVTVWSLLCLATYGFFDLIGRTLARHADAFSSDPYTVEWLWRVLSTLHSFSTGAVVFVWATVSLLILAVPWIFDKVLGGAGRRVGRASFPGPAPAVGPGPGGVIDLAPDQYSVGPSRGRGPGGSVPRITPRP